MWAATRNGRILYEHQLDAARECYDSWAKTALSKQTLAMRAVTGIAP
jgi:hypothetical protein